jgi:predicted GNAT family N-acyltransferase
MSRKLTKEEVDKRKRARSLVETALKLLEQATDNEEVPLSAQAGVLGAGVGLHIALNRWPKR